MTTTSHTPEVRELTQMGVQWGFYCASSQAYCTLSDANNNELAVGGPCDSEIMALRQAYAKLRNAWVRQEPRRKD